jgi:hypothetical protein
MMGEENPGESATSAGHLLWNFDRTAGDVSG